MRRMVAALAFATMLLPIAASAADWQPSRPVEFVVASGAGGGTDIFARTVQSIVVKYKLLAQPTVVLNKGGGSGAEGFVYVKSATGDPHKMVFGTNNEWMLPLVAKVGWKYDELNPVAAMAFDEFLLWTRPNAPWKTASEYIADAKKRGDTKLQDDLVKSYLPYRDSVSAYDEQLSKQILGYEPKQIILLHGNNLEADHIGELLDVFRKRGYRFITLEDALSDQAYGLPDTYVGEEGTGWLDHWGEEHSVVPVESFVGKYDTLLQNGISVSLYMFHGGTNFGFMNGANYGGKFQPQPTSYDYDAPLDEAGRPTPKYFKLREVLKKYQPAGSVLPIVPQSTPVIEIPRFELSQSASLFDALPKPIASGKLLTMEDEGQSYGYILCRTQINQNGRLVIDGLRDYALVFADGKKIASLDRRYKQRMLDIVSSPATLDILVENGGRINYGRQILDNRKGITGRVTLDGTELTGWEIFPLPMNDVSGLKFERRPAASAPAFYRGSFTLTSVGDAFLDMRGWKKGCVWVNGHNLGKFWYIGPQQTLYLPGVWLKQGENEVVVFDLEQHEHHSLQGLAEPILGALVKDDLMPPLPVRVPGKLRLRDEDVVSSGEFAPGDSVQTRRFVPRQSRYLCLESLSSLRDDPFASVGELYVLVTEGKPLPREHWSVFAVESEELKAEDGRAENAFDDDPESIWHTQWGDAKPPHPHYLAIDIGKEEMVSGFQYRSRLGNAPGKIKKFRFYLRQVPFERLR